MKRWDFVKNGEMGLDPENIMSNYSKKAFFICENGHSYSRSVSREVKSHKCNYCNSLAFIAPESIDMLTENNERSAWEYTKGSEIVIEIKCNKHGLMVKAVNQFIEISKNGSLSICSFCNKENNPLYSFKLPDSGYSLSETHECLSRIWSDKNELPMNVYTHGSDKKVWWKCDNTDYHPDYKQAISGKTLKGVGCPYCSGRKVHEKDSFGAKFPDYVNLWSDKNIKTPFEYPPHSKSKAWFKCENNIHEDYLQTVSNKSHHKMCLLCSHKTTPLKSSYPKTFEESLESKIPNQKIYWSDKNIRNMDEYKFGSDKEVWWKCEKGKHEDYLQRISNRVYKEYKCPRCKEPRGEVLVANILNELNQEYISQHIFDGLVSVNGGTLMIDFYIPSRNLCIEYDGIQHFEPVEYFGGQKAFDTQTINDSIKDRYCKENNIKMIRIPYYINDDEVRDIIKLEFIK